MFDVLPFDVLLNQIWEAMGNYDLVVLAAYI